MLKTRAQYTWLPALLRLTLLTFVSWYAVMSAHDSVNTVYKCMLRGDADFLVKPVRKNELKNLWQHVWRRQASVSEGPQATSDAQQKVEATAENNAVSNHSSGYEACIKRDRECIEKGSDAQSSCTKPDLEAQEANLGYKQDLTQQSQNKFLLCGIKMKKHDQSVKESEQMRIQDGEAYGSQAVPNTVDMNLTSSKDNVTADGLWDCVNVSSVAFDKNNVPAKSFREAIDLIGAFENYPKLSSRSVGLTYGTNKVDHFYGLMLLLFLLCDYRTEQMGRIVNELDSINFSIKKASQLVKEIGRQVATDRCIMALLFLIVVGVIAVIIVKGQSSSWEASIHNLAEESR